MQRQGFEQPLLIGGATTSPAHTSVKIDPQYKGPVVYVKDASRSVGICQQLVTAATRAEFVAKVKSDHATRREQHHGKKIKSPQLTIAQARANRFNGGWDTYVPPVPRFLGVRVFDDYSLEDLTRYIDWMPFFNAWEFARQVSGHPHRSDRRRAGQQSVRGCAAHAEAGHPRALADGARRDRPVPGEQRR